MPENATEPQVIPTAKPAPSPIITGESHADRFKVGTALPEPAPRSDFSRDLAAAQARDAGKSDLPVATPEPDKASAPAAPGTPPKVPGLPQPEEWRPRGEKAGQQWDALKQKHAEEAAALKAEIEMARKELMAAKSGGLPEFETLKQERDKYREILRDVAIERDPEFQRSYSTREKAAVDAAVQAAGDKGDKLAKLLSAPNSPWRDEQINKMLEDMPASSQRRINAALSVMEQVDVERTAEIARRRATFDEKQSAIMSQQKERDAAMQKQMQAAYDATEKQWRERHPFFQERKGDDQYNTEVAQSLQLAKAIFSGQLSPEELAQASLWAASGERVLKGWQAAVQRAEAAEAMVDKLRGVQPGGGIEGDQAESGGEKTPEPGSPAYLKFLNNRIREAQARDVAATGSRR